MRRGRWWCSARRRARRVRLRRLLLLLDWQSLWKALEIFLLIAFLVTITAKVEKFADILRDTYVYGSSTTAQDNIGVHGIHRMGQVVLISLALHTHTIF